MADVHIRIYFQAADGSLEDSQLEYGVENFAGFVPVIGDMIVDPGVLEGLNRHEPKNRRVWDVVGRVFNPRDMADHIALVLQDRVQNPHEYNVITC